MSCQNHPNKESIANCQFCGKELCEDCSISIAGKSYCEECMSDLVGPELTNIAAGHPGETRVTDTPKPTPKAPQKQSLPPQEPKRKKEKKKAKEKENIDDVDNGEYDDIYSDDRLYNDIHGDESPSTNQDHSKVEEKYEKYLDDLYFDETEPQGNVGSVQNKDLPLSEQLAQDEAEHGSITKDPFIQEDEDIYPETYIPEESGNRNIPIMENLRNVDSDTEINDEGEGEHTLFSIHQGRIHYKNKESEPYTSTEKILTVVLIILIILVSLYIIYLITLHSHYPNVLDAITAFIGDPGEVIGKMFD